MNTEIYGVSPVSLMSKELKTIAIQTYLCMYRSKQIGEGDYRRYSTSIEHRTHRVCEWVTKGLLIGAVIGILRLIRA